MQQGTMNPTTRNFGGLEQEEMNFLNGIGNPPPITMAQERLLRGPQAPGLPSTGGVLSRLTQRISPGATQTWATSMPASRLTGRTSPGSLGNSAILGPQQRTTAMGGALGPTPETSRQNWVKDLGPRKPIRSPLMPEGKPERIDLQDPVLLTFFTQNPGNRRFWDSLTPEEQQKFYQELKTRQSEYGDQFTSHSIENRNYENNLKRLRGMYQDQWRLQREAEAYMKTNDLPATDGLGPNGSAAGGGGYYNTPYEQVYYPGGGDYSSDYARWITNLTNWNI